MITKSSLIKQRPFKEADRGFIFSTWLKGQRYGLDFFKLTDKDSYYKNYHNYIEGLLAQPTTTVSVVCLKEDEDTVLAYSVYTGDTVHWVYVKSSWRNIGLAKSLVPKTFNRVTSLTNMGASIIGSKRGVIFDPFFKP